MIENIMAVMLGASIGVYATSTSNIEAPEERADVKKSPVEQVVIVPNDKGFEEEGKEEKVEQLTFHDSNYNWNNNKEK